MALRFSNSIVGNRKSPACFSRLISNDKKASGPVADKGMFERIDHELRDNETDADRLGDEAVPPSEVSTSTSITWTELGRAGRSVAPQMCRGQRLSRGLSGESTRMNCASRWPETNDG